jgi:hypothetical protein
MDSLKRLQDFFRAEIETEVQSDFARLERIPDSYVASKLQYYRSLDQSDRVAFLDCCAYWASVHYGFVINAPRIPPTAHPFFNKWLSAPSWNTDWDNVKSVPHLRAMVQQYKIDQHRRGASSVTQAQFERASSVRSVKAPELRKRARGALRPLGYYRQEKRGDDIYWCKQRELEFFVDVDYGGRSAQLRYSVARPEFRDVHPCSQFRFERAMGFGLGDWDYIIEENVDAAFSLFAEVVQYSFELPDRIKSVMK